MFRRIFLFLLTVVLLLSSCATLKPYQRVHLNDEDMLMVNRKLEFFEDNFQTYREGASGAIGSKVGGGCGCN